MASVIWVFFFFFFLQLVWFKLHIWCYKSRWNVTTDSWALFGVGSGGCMSGKLTPRLSGLVCIEQLLALNDASSARWQRLYARYFGLISFYTGRKWRRPSVFVLVVKTQDKYKWTESKTVFYVIYLNMAVQSLPGLPTSTQSGGSYQS